MDQIQEKIELFEDHLLQRAKKEHDALTDSAQKRQNERIQTAEKALQEEKRNIEERNYQIIFRDKNRIIADGRNQAKNDRLNFHHQIQKDFMKTVLNFSKDLKDSVLYKDFIEKSVSAIPALFGNKKDLIFTLCEKDSGLVASMIAVYLPDFMTRMNYSEDSAFSSGGFTVCDLGEHFFCDFTISRLLRENSQKIGHFLNEKMKPYKEGENHDES